MATELAEPVGAVASRARDAAARARLRRMGEPLDEPARGYEVARDAAGTVKTLPGYSTITQARPRLISKTTKAPMSTGRIRFILLMGEQFPSDPQFLHGIKIAEGPGARWYIHDDEIERWTGFPHRSGAPTDEDLVARGREPRVGGTLTEIPLDAVRIAQLAGTDMEAVRGVSRARKLVEVRRAIATMMDAQGMTASAIGRVLNCHYTSVQNLLRPRQNPPAAAAAPPRRRGRRPKEAKAMTGG